MKHKLFIAVFSVLLSSLFVTAASIADTEKMTYEKAMNSYKATIGKYATQSVTEQQSQLAWDTYKQKPEISPSSGSAGMLEDVWSGSSNSVPFTWGKGDYYVVFNLGNDSTEASTWITIDNKTTNVRVAVPSHWNYEGNYFIQYANGQLTSYQTKTKGAPVIIRIARMPAPMGVECSPGTSESNNLYCTSGRTCEVGRQSRSCASNGTWNLFTTTSQPICVSAKQQCP